MLWITGLVKTDRQRLIQWVAIGARWKRGGIFEDDIFITDDFVSECTPVVTFTFL